MLRRMFTATLVATVFTLIVPSPRVTAYSGMAIAEGDIVVTSANSGVTLTDGSAINPFMPWKSFAKMTDNEIIAIWLYLKSVPPKPTGNK